MVLIIWSRLNASYPPPPGIVMSRTMRSGLTCRAIIGACTESNAEWTRKPCFSRAPFRTVWIIFSSSTTRMRRSAMR